MVKTLVLESMYEAVKESLEWGIDCKDCSHSFHIDGIVAVTEMILNKLEEAMKCWSRNAKITSTESAFKESITIQE